MKLLNNEQVQNVSGGNPYLVVVGVLYVASKIAEGWNDAHHEHCE